MRKPSRWALVVRLISFPIKPRRVGGELRKRSSKDGSLFPWRRCGVEESEKGDPRGRGGQRESVEMWLCCGKTMSSIREKLKEGWLSPAFPHSLSLFSILTLHSLSIFSHLHEHTDSPIHANTYSSPCVNFRISDIIPHSRGRRHSLVILSIKMRISIFVVAAAIMAAASSSVLGGPTDVQELTKRGYESWEPKMYKGGDMAAFSKE